jgi:hypothetical protein
MVIALAMIGTTTTMMAVNGQGDPEPRTRKIAIIAVEHERKVPIAISGDNIYIAWPTNRTGNDEVNFRASTDGGTTFADKINISNSTAADSQDVEIAADGDNVIITWWERNQTAEEPVAKLSTDNGATFGPLLKLATNGTIGSSGGSNDTG